jgi:phage repressor protein C with HTH and peptisase S24 domain
MPDDDRTALQNELAEAIAKSGRTRDSLDGTLRKMLDTKGKPLWDIERGRTRRPGPRMLRAIEQVLGYEADYLVDLVHPREVAETSSKQQVAIRTAAGHAPTAAEQPRVHTADAGETVGIVQLDLSLSMGPGHDIEDFVESDIIGFDASVLRGLTRTPADRLRFVTGIGTSHEPKFQSGDQFLININERAITRIDGYYWITFEGGAHGLKRLRPVSGGRVLIMSDNKEDYPPYEVEASEIRIEGRAIWFARGL